MKAIVGVVLVALGVGASSPGTAPTDVTIATARGESRIPVLTETGHAALATPLLEQLLPIADTVESDWATVAFAGEPFRFLLGAPVMLQRGRVVPLAGGAYVARDTLFVPLQWLAEFVPRLFSEGYRYDATQARFEEARFAAAAPAAAPRSAPPIPSAFRAPSDLARRNGFRMAHLVVVDPGHGGTDPGNPGRFLPRGVKEKDINLGIAKRLRVELEHRGVQVLLTRTADTLIGLYDRAPMCRAECDLFVSVHVNSLNPRRGYESVDGIETYFLGAALTAEARRVAAMENDALRYEHGSGEDTTDVMQFILKDLHSNEYLRESARLADLVQNRAAAAHPGENRGVAQAPYVVLKTATRPAVLVETGYATNRRDGAFLASSAGQAKLAAAIAQGIVDYLKEYERKVLVQEPP